MATIPQGKLPLKVRVDGVAELHEAMVEMAKLELLVGFPEDTTGREPDPEEPEWLTNAALGYIHDQGAPEVNIPARPFMLPAMDEFTPRAATQLGSLAKQILRRQVQTSGVMAEFHKLGLRAQSAIRRKINEGIPPPLSDVTLLKRAAKGREGAMWELAWRQAGAPPGLELAKPLIDTGQMRNAVNYVIRPRKDRR